MDTTPARETAARYLERFARLMEEIDLHAVERVVKRLGQARDLGAAVYIAGNGGSASTATHWANDLGKATKREGRASIRVLSMSDNTSWLTALANDEGYERVFAGQLENFAKPGDVLIVISASGNSANLVAAVELARSFDMTTIGLLGFDGGRLKDLVDEALHLPTDVGEYGPVETGHVLLADIVTTCLIEDHGATS